MKRKQTLFISLGALILALACAVPGLGGQSAPVIPTDVPGKFETAIAGTSSAAMALTSAAASPTPEPTITPTPTATLKALEGADSTIIKQPDGSTQFIDKMAGYSITVPTNWIAFRINQQEYYEAWSLPAMANPKRQKFFNTLKDRDPNLFRLAAIDARDDHIEGDLITSLIFGWLEDENISLESDEDLKRISSDYVSSDGFKPSVLSTSILTLPSGLKIGVIEWEISQVSASGETIVFYQQQTLFPKSSGGATTIWLTTANNLKDALLPEFNAMLATLATP